MIQIDEKKQVILVVGETGTHEVPLYSDEAFRIVSDLYLKIGWTQKYTYTFSWMGRPVIQLPDDMLRLQEVIYRLKPDVIVETGVAHGGSLIFYGSLCKAMGKGRVIGIDIEIRPHNRRAIEEHEMSGLIELFEGSSTDPKIVSAVKASVGDAATVLVLLDSNHTYAHVMDELEAYHEFVTPGSYIVSTDGVMRDVKDTPRGQPEWATDNPANAAEDFVKDKPNFVIEQPAWLFNESTLSQNVTHWPSAWIKREA
ncbi:CmcI family methyltransferase [Fodinicurvata sp. EGI_FJ10296]|uniref:cephalosporin hydroxylase family protein n=1 Tax=Fodinicurvata sp. EGI_FJ10296 TaxID=3231908 RepID=UPI0034560D24